MPSFNEFDFQTALSPQPGANFAACDFKKSSDHASFWRFWFPNRSFGLARRHLGQPILRARPFLGAAFASQRQPHNYGQTVTNVTFRAIPTRQNDRVSHVCAVSFLRDRIFCWRIFGGNAQYSRKLDSYISIHFLFESSIWCKSIGCRICSLSLPACLVYLPFVSPLLKLNVYIYTYIYIHMIYIYIYIWIYINICIFAYTWYIHISTKYIYIYIYIW